MLTYGCCGELGERSSARGTRFPSSIRSARPACLRARRAREAVPLAEHVGHLSSAKPSSFASINSVMSLESLARDPVAQPDQEAVQATANPLVVRSVHPVNDAGYGVVGKRALYAAKSVRSRTDAQQRMPL